MGRLRDLLDELHAREADERLAADTRAQNRWDGEGGAVFAARSLTDQPEVDQRVLDDSASRSTPSTASSPGMTDSF